MYSPARDNDFKNIVKDFIDWVKDDDEEE